MEALHQRVETWIKDQSVKILKISWPQKWTVVINWPWSDGREQRRRIKEEYERRKKQLHNLCHAVKAESVSDLQDILCCMVLSECVYKVRASTVCVCVFVLLRVLLSCLCVYIVCACSLIRSTIYVYISCVCVCVSIGKIDC